MYKLRDNLFFEKIEDEGVIVDVESGKYIRTNSTAYEILQAIADGMNEQAICKQLCSHYGISYDIANKALFSAVEQMKMRGFLVESTDQ